MNDQVEQQVRQFERTALAEANQELGREIAQRKQAEAVALRRLVGVVS